MDEGLAAHCWSQVRVWHPFGPGVVLSTSVANQHRVRAGPRFDWRTGLVTGGPQPDAGGAWTHSVDEECLVDNRMLTPEDVDEGGH